MVDLQATNLTTNPTFVALYATVDDTVTTKATLVEELILGRKTQSTAVDFAISTCNPTVGAVIVPAWWLTADTALITKYSDLASFIRTARVGLQGEACYQNKPE